MPYGLTDAGFFRKTESELFAELVAEGRSRISPSLDGSPDTVFGQLAGILSSKLAEIWEALEAAYNAISPNAAADALRRVAALTGTYPLGATRSTVTLSVTTNGAGSWLAGQIVATVSGNPSARFSSAEALAVPSAGTWPVQMQADTAGPVQAPLGTLTVLESPSGTTPITGIVNAADAVQGRLEETDAELRVRRIAELVAPGSSSVDSIRSAVSKVSGVDALAVKNNRDDATDSGGRPPHSVETIVRGGLDDAIAQAIWDNLPAGIEPYSDTADSGSAVDAEGNTQTVAFTRATHRRLRVRITGTKDAAVYGVGGDTAVKDVVRLFTAGTATLAASTNVVTGPVGFGGTVLRDHIAAVAMTVPGMLTVTTVEFSEDGVSWANADYVVDEREYIGPSASVFGVANADTTLVLT